MRLFCSFFLLLLVMMIHLGSGRRFGGGRSSSRSSSSRSSSRSSWGSSRSSSSYSRPSSSSSRSSSSSSWAKPASTPRKSLGTKIKNKFGFGKKKPTSSGSSYPKQQWSSSSNPKTPGGGLTNSNPKVPGGSTPIGGGGFTQPKTSSGTNFAAGGLAGAGAGGLAGGLVGKGSSSSLGGGGFVQPKPFGGSGLSGTGTGLGGGGFVNPKPSSGTGFGSFGNTKPMTTGSNFGAGGLSTGSNFGAGGLGGSSGGSGWKKMAGAGLAGGLIGGGASKLGKGYKKNPFGMSQYSSFGKPKKSLGSYMFGSSKKKYGYKTPGYGTAFGTNFAGGVGKYKAKKGFSKKALGLGIGAGFLGGAALGVAGTMASYSVYHRYQEFKRMMSMQQPGYGGWNDGYYQNNYLSNTCLGGCPMNSHCEWGFCECNAGTSRKWGRCESNWSNIPPRVSTFDPFKTCSSSATCMAMDMNLVCNTDLTTSGTMGKCECRPDMKWNTQSGECQMYLDVDCSKITYDTKPSAYISSAVERAQSSVVPVIGETVALGRTETMQESLSNSLLKQVDPNQASTADMTEAFCRDIDAYSFEFQQAPQTPGLPQAPIGKPPKCQDVPLSACAVAYDSHDCSGGWRLVIPQGGLRFRWWTSYWTYRNDIDTLGIRAGCSLTAFTDSSYNGDRVTIAAERGYDRWVVLGEEAQYLHMDQDIESVQCACRN